MSFLSDLTILPSDASNVGFGAQDLRAFKKRFATNFGTWVYYPGSGGASNESAGLLKPGASKVFVGPESLSSYSAVYPVLNKMIWDTSDNEMMLCGNLEEGSAVTSAQIIGGRAITEASLSSKGVAWVTLSHETLLTASVPGSVSWPYRMLNDSYQDALIFVDATPDVLISFSDTDMYGHVSEATEGGFTSVLSYSGVTSATTLYWFASGYVALGDE